MKTHTVHGQETIKNNKLVWNVSNDECYTSDMPSDLLR